MEFPRGDSYVLAFSVGKMLARFGFVVNPWRPVVMRGGCGSLCSRHLGAMRAHHVLHV